MVEIDHSTSQPLAIMLNSNLAIRLNSGKPLAIEPIAAQKFLANVAEVNSDDNLKAALKKVAYSPKAKETPKKKAEHSEELEEQYFKMFAMPFVPQVTAKGTAIICINGVIGKNLTAMEKCLGCTDVNDIVASMRMYEKDPKVQRVVLKFNSGGGTTTGLEETARYIFNYPKQTIAFTDEDMGSAAFWLGSQCQRLIVTPSSSIGSCGIYVSLVDESKHYADEGKEVIVIKSGMYKGAGVEGVSLTQAQGDWIQQEVDELHTRFIAAVKRARPMANEDDLQGQSFYGDIAAQRGLATGVVDSWEELIEQLEGPQDQMNINQTAYTKPQVVTVR